MKHIVFERIRHDKMTFALVGEHHEFIVRESGDAEHYINSVLRAQIDAEHVEDYALTCEGFPVEELGDA